MPGEGKVADRRVTLDVSAEFVDEIRRVSSRLGMTEVQVIRLAVRVLNLGTMAESIEDPPDMEALKKGVRAVI